VPSFAQAGAAIRLPFHYAGTAINRSLLYLQSHDYFVPNKDGAKNRFRPLLGGLGDGSGLAGGLEFRQTIPGRMRVAIGGEVSTHLYQQYTFRLSKDFSGFRTGPVLRVGVFPEEDFFGEGSSSQQSDRTTYAVTEGWTGWETTAGAGHVHLRHDLRWEHDDLAPGKDSRFPTTQSVFSPSQVSGGYAGTSWLANEFGVTMDFRDNRDDPKSGDSIDVSVIRADGLGSTTSDLTTIRAVNTAYFPLSSRRFHVIAIRAEAVRNLGSDPVPFYLQPTLGGSHTLRGFREYRFRDRDALALTAEYRYRIWRYMDATLFGDFGQVYENLWKEIDDRRLEAAGGFGLRLNTPSGLRLRMNIGHSNEGTRLFLSMGSTW
jgi:outer membrane protein assembly factor BamA